MKAKKSLVREASVAALLFGLIGAAAGQGQELNSQQKALLDSMKAFAQSKNNVQKTAQGTFYFKWLSSLPPDYEKAYFKLAELPNGSKMLFLSLLKKTGSGYELTTLVDKDANWTVDDAYKATGKTLAEADNNISKAPDKTKISITPEMHATYKAMLEQLKYDVRQ